MVDFIPLIGSPMIFFQLSLSDAAVQAVAVVHSAAVPKDPATSKAKFRSVAAATPTVPERRQLPDPQNQSATSIDIIEYSNITSSGSTYMYPMYLL